MRTTLQICLSSLLILALPTIGAKLSGVGTDVGPRVNHAVSEGSGDTVKAVQGRSFLDLSYIFGSTESKDPSSALDTAGGDQPGVAHESLPDFWEMAKESEKTLQDYAHRLLEGAAAYFNSTKFTDVKFTMTDIVVTTTTFRDNINGALDTHNVTFDTFSQELESVFMVILSDLEGTPSPDQAPGHAERAEMVDKILNGTAQELIKFATRYGIKKDDVTTFVFDLKPPVQALMVAIGDINEQCPQLLPSLVFSVTVLLIPEQWILRPFLCLFGFGPAGPVKGSVAAWSQSRFWGTAVKADSWFSWLQAAGMGALPKWVDVITKVPMLVGGLLTGYFSCFNHG